MRIFLSFICIFFSVLHGLSQDPTSALGTAKRAEIMREMDLGEELMNRGEHEQADEKFRFVLKNIDVVPANLAFFIGKNSFGLNQYKQSIDWLNKYIELRGTSGTFYDEAVELLKKAETSLIESKDKSGVDSLSSSSLDSLFSHNYIDCGESGMVICPVCKGKTVIITKGKLGNVYKTCPYSDKNGRLTCDEYNLLLQGKLKPRNQ